MSGHCKLIVLLLIGVGVLVAVSTAIGSNAAAATVAATFYEVEVPKSNQLFNFAYYKQTFGKHYRSFLEEVARQRLFLASSARAWISSIKYKYKLKPYYLSVNNLSDRSREEKARMRNKYAGLDSEPDMPTQDSRGSMQPPEQLPSENEKEIHEALASEPHGQSRKKRSIEHEWGLYPLGYRADDWVNKGTAAWGRAGKSNQVGGLSAPQEKWHKPMVDKGSIGDESTKLSGSIGEGDREIKLQGEMFVDHRASGCLLPPRYQGDCGSCYAFASIAMMEWLHCKKTGKLVAFSEQYMIDCGRKLKGEAMNGCEGATDDAVPKFIREYGLELRDKYPQRAKEGQCPYAADFDLNKTVGTIRMELNVVLQLKRSQFADYIEHSPIYIAISEDDNFGDYGGGVDDGFGCKGQIDHAMLLVGHGREDNTDYWLIRNSFGTHWGVGGYYKLAKSATEKCLDRVGYIYGTHDDQIPAVQPKKTN